MYQSPKENIEQARKMAASSWEEASGFYYKAIRFYMEDKVKYKKELADLYFEMAEIVFEYEKQQHKSGVKPIVLDTSKTYTYLIEANKLFTELCTENPAQYDFKLALVQAYFAYLYIYCDDEIDCIYDEDVVECFDKAVEKMNIITDKNKEVEISRAQLLFNYGYFCYQRLKDYKRSLEIINSTEEILQNLTAENPELETDPLMEQLFDDINDLQVMNREGGVYA